MAQLDLQIDEKPVRSRNGRQDYRLIQQPRPRGVIAQVATLLLQPGVFFRTLPAFENSRQWLLVAVVILATTGLMAVRQAELAAVPEVGAGPDTGVMPEGLDPRMGGGEAISGDFGGLPADMGMPIDAGASGGAAPTGDDGGVSTTWTTALLAGGALVAAWLLQALLLSEVTLFNGRAPRMGLNLQVAVYAGVPLALMTGLQALYYTAGGKLGEPGLTGLVTEWTGFVNQTPFVQALLVSLASRLTLFWLWGLLLLYLGARHALRGRWWASLLVVFAWVAIVVVAPVLTGAITAPPTEEAIPTGDLPGDFPGGMEGGPDLPLEGRPGEPTFGDAASGDPSELKPEDESASVDRSEVEDGAADAVSPAVEGDSADAAESEAQEILPGGGEPVTSSGVG